MAIEFGVMAFTFNARHLDAGIPAGLDFFLGHSLYFLKSASASLKSSSVLMSIER